MTKQMRKKNYIQIVTILFLALIGLFALSRLEFISPGLIASCSSKIISETRDPESEAAATLYIRGCMLTPSHRMVKIKFGNDESMVVYSVRDTVDYNIAWHPGSVLIVSGNLPEQGAIQEVGFRSVKIEYEYN